MSASAISATRATPSYRIWLITAAAAIALILSLVAYFTPHGAIAQSGGALLVVVSTALMLGAALLISLAKIPRWLVTLFNVLIVLDVIGTGIAAYFLEADVLLLLMVIALIGWIIHLFSRSSRVSAA